MADKLFTLIANLKGAEKSRFGDFLRSPYFNKSAQIQNLYDAIVIHLRTGRAIDGILQSKYPEFPTDQFSVLKSRLSKLLKRFRAQEMLEQRSIQPILAEIEFLLGSRQFEDAKRQIKRLRDNTQKSNEKGIRHSSDLVEISLAEFIYHRCVSDADDVANSYRQSMESQLMDSFCRITVLAANGVNEPFCYDDYSARQTNESLVRLLTDQRLHFPKLFETYPLNLIWHALEVKRGEGDPEVFASLLRSKESMQDDKLNFYCYRILANHYGKGLATNVEENATKVIACYDRIIDQQFYHKPYLTDEIVTNMVNCHLYLNQPQEALDFLKKHSAIISPNHKSNLIYRDYARCYAEMGQYTDAIDYLNRVTPPNDYEYAKIKARLLTWYFDAKLDANAISLIATIRTFCSNNRSLPKDQISRLKDLCTFVNTMIKHRTSEEKKKAKSYLVRAKGIIDTYSAKNMFLLWMNSKIEKTKN